MYFYDFLWLFEVVSFLCGCNACVSRKNVFVFFSPLQYVLSSVFIYGSGERKWQETTINQALKAESKALKELPFFEDFMSF